MAPPSNKIVGNFSLPRGFGFEPVLNRQGNPEEVTVTNGSPAGTKITGQAYAPNDSLANSGFLEGRRARGVGYAGEHYTDIPSRFNLLQRRGNGKYYPFYNRNVYAGLGLAPEDYELGNTEAVDRAPAEYDQPLPSTDAALKQSDSTSLMDEQIRRYNAMARSQGRQDQILSTGAEEFQESNPTFKPRPLNAYNIHVSYQNPTTGAMEYYTRTPEGRLQRVGLSDQQQQEYNASVKALETQQQQTAQQRRTQQLDQYAGADQARGWGALRGANDGVVMVGKDKEGRPIYEQYRDGEPHDMGPHHDANGRPVMTRAEAGLASDYRNEDERRWQLEQREKASRRPLPGKPLHLRRNKYRQPWR